LLDIGHPQSLLSTWNGAAERSGQLSKAVLNSD